MYTFERLTLLVLTGQFTRLTTATYLIFVQFYLKIVLVYCEENCLVIYICNLLKASTNE